MVDKICDKLMDRVKAKMPEVDEERAEVIRYGFELTIGETPKIFILFGIAFILGIFKYTVISVIIISLYRFCSGGIHLKTHIGCMLGTTCLYVGSAIMSQMFFFQNDVVKNFFSIFVYVFAVTMITLYVPADTENVPILRKKDRKKKKIMSYIIVSLYLFLALSIRNRIVSNIFIIGVFFQSMTISRLAYKIFKIKYGYLEYIKTEKNAM